MIVDIRMDVGGTGIKGAACIEGELQNIMEFPARSGESKEALIRHFARIIDTLAGEHTIRHVAMAFPGPFDYKKGIPYMRGLAKYEALYGVKLIPAITEELTKLRKVSKVMSSDTVFLNQDSAAGITWSFLNDVSAYALGVAKTHDLSGRTMCVCLGTGAGSAFLDGRTLVTDPECGVPENGWIYCLPYKDSVIDDYLSDRGIRKLSTGILGKEYSPKEVSETAELQESTETAQDTFQVNIDRSAAIRVFSVFGEDLCSALQGPMLDFHTETLVLGGKITLSEKLFSGKLKRLCEEKGIRLLVEADTTQMALIGLE